MDDAGAAIVAGEGGGEIERVEGGLGVGDDVMRDVAGGAAEEGGDAAAGR